MRTVTWSKGSVKMIDQTALPTRLTFVTYTRPEQIAEAIRNMVIRGAPAIGVAAAMGVALSAVRSKSKDRGELLKELERSASLIRSTRPTAVNLFWGIDRVLKVARSAKSAADVKEVVAKEVKKMEEDDIETNKRLGQIGSNLIENGDTVLTQCNAGALATVGYGTALGVVRAAVKQKKLVKVIVPETRPALQGARLTSYELVTDGIDCTVIADTAVGHVLSIGRVDKVIVGADRITRDGYLFNKIGTYQMAVLADRHRVPFYTVAPFSSFDLSQTHEQVTIEERKFDEVVYVRGKRIVAKGVPIFNPAFDMTPPELVTAMVSDKGFIERPFEENIAKVIS